MWLVEPQYSQECHHLSVTTTAHIRLHSYDEVSKVNTLQEILAFILPLADVSARLSQVGGKGASLRAWQQQACLCPPGFHVTTAAYRRFVTENELQEKILSAVSTVAADQPVEGRALGSATADEGDQLQTGEVLVTSVTDVGWTPLFPRAAAVVTDVGTPLSHAAIVARELGIPVVVGCGNATMRLRTGAVRTSGGRRGPPGTVRVQPTVQPRPGRQRMLAHADSPSAQHRPGPGWGTRQSCKPQVGRAGSN